MKPEFVRNPYNYDSDQLSTDTGLHCKDESLTEQEHLEESDINYIAEKFMRTGLMPQVLNMPTYGDFSGIFDFQSAMNIIAKAREEFMSLPAKLRTRFNNDPHELINFLEDDTNRDEAVRLGLVNPPAPKPENDDAKADDQVDRTTRSRSGKRDAATPAGGTTKKGEDADPS